MAHLGAELLSARLHARVALLMSWPNWWAVENQHVPSRLNYLEELQEYHRALWKRNLTVDIISPDDALEGYDLVVAPLFNLVSQGQGTAIKQYVAQGGTFLTTYFSGLIDEDHRALNHLDTVQHIPLTQPMCDVLTRHIYEQEVRLPALGVVVLVPVR